MPVYYTILSIIFGTLFWLMLCWDLIKQDNIRAKIDTVLFFGGAMTLVLLELNTSDHTTAFFSAVFSTAVVVRAVSYFKFEVSRDIVASAQNIWSTLKIHPLACIVCLLSIWSFIDSANTVIG